MKLLCVAAIILISLFLTPTARYNVIPHAQAESPASVPNIAKAPLSGDASILLEAHQLANTYGIRPFWLKTPFIWG